MTTNAQMTPITITYRIEKEDLRKLSAALPAPGGTSLTKFLLTMLISIAAMAVTVCILEKDTLTRWAVILAVLGLLLYMFRSLLFVLWRGFRARNVENTVIVTEEGIRGKSAQSEWQMGWEQFGGWKPVEGMLLALNVQSGNYHIFPRRAFATQADYDAVRDLLARKIGPAIGFHMNPITITYRIEFEDYEQACLLTSSQGRRNRVVGLCLAGLFVLIWVVRGLAHYFDPRPGDITPTGYDVAFLAIVILWIPLMNWAWRRNQRKIYQQMEKLREKFVTSITEDHINISVAGSDATMKWPFFKEWKSTDHVVVLLESQLLMRIIPRRAFASQEDYDAFLELLTRKIGPAK